MSELNKEYAGGFIKFMSDILEYIEEDNSVVVSNPETKWLVGAFDKIKGRDFIVTY